MSGRATEHKAKERKLGKLFWAHLEKTDSTHGDLGGTRVLILTHGWMTFMDKDNFHECIEMDKE